MPVAHERIRDMRRVVDTAYSGDIIIALNGCEYWCMLCDKLLKLNAPFDLANVHLHVFNCTAPARVDDTTRAAGAIVRRRAEARKLLTPMNGWRGRCMHSSTFDDNPQFSAA